MTPLETLCVSAFIVGAFLIFGYICALVLAKRIDEATARSLSLDQKDV